MEFQTIKSNNVASFYTLSSSNNENHELASAQSNKIIIIQSLYALTEWQKQVKSFCLYFQWPKNTCELLFLYSSDLRITLIFAYIRFE